jgi:GTP-binding protein
MNAPGLQDDEPGADRPARARILTATQGEAIMHHRFEASRARCRPSGNLSGWQGVLIATDGGQVTPYRGEPAGGRPGRAVRQAPGEQVYAGQIVGEHNRDNDLTW